MLQITLALLTFFISWWILLGFFLYMITWLPLAFHDLAKWHDLRLYCQRLWVFLLISFIMFWKWIWVLLSGIMPFICCINWTNITFKLYFGVSFEMMTWCQRFLIYPPSSSPLADLQFWPRRFLLKLNFENFAKNDQTFLIPKVLIKCKELC